MLKKLRDGFVHLALEGRFLFLLFSIVLMILLAPLLEGKTFVKLLTDILYSLIFVTGVYAVARERRSAVTATVLAAPLLVLTWLNHFLQSPVLNVATKILGILLFAFILVFILRFVLKQREVTLQVICGALVGYLVIGLLWAFVYAILDTVFPGSFSDADGSLGHSRVRFLYFSYVTLSTLGYGDVTPLNAFAGSVVVLEAIVGQIYLAVLIAGLVGIHVSQIHERDRSRGEGEGNFGGKHEK